MRASRGTGRRVIGLMSGTSLDGIDGVIVEETMAPRPAPPIRVRAHVHQAFPPALREELLALNSPGADELARAALAANALARHCADVVATLQAEDPSAADIAAVGVHGQTVRHQPGSVDGVGYTLQLNAPALLAELTGLDVVADFRSRDVAAGGQGAPLVPAFHRAMFGRADEPVAVLNLGGISNLSLIDGEAVRGFDCGPANALLDLWIDRHLGRAYDDDGRWAASGQVEAPLLRAFGAEPYLALPPPKSTGRDLFHAAWLDRHLQRFPALAPVDVQATLAEFTAACVADDLARHAPGTRSLIVCGGGAANSHVLRRIAARRPGVQVQTSDALGLPASQVEAAAFAWLALRFLDRQPGNLASVTGARGPRVLGALYPGR